MVHQPEFSNKAILCSPEDSGNLVQPDNLKTLKDVGTPAVAPNKRIVEDYRPGMSGT